MAFTEKQRISLRERDLAFGRQDNETPGCNFPHDHKSARLVECKGRLEVHHILPQMFGYVWLKALQEEIDSELNALTVCQNSHVGTNYSIHPDQAGINRRYHNGEVNVFKELQESRRHLAEQGLHYWNTTYDAVLVYQAIKNTKKAESNGWELGRKGILYTAERNLRIIK